MKILKNSSVMSNLEQRKHLRKEINDFEALKNSMTCLDTFKNKNALNWILKYLFLEVIFLWKKI